MILGCLISQLNSIGNIRANMNMSRKVFKNLLKHIPSVAFPLLGTNNGGLDKDVVKRMMIDYLSKCEIPVEIYDYDPMASDDLYETFKKRWLSIPDNKKKLVTKIRTQKQIDTIDYAVKSDDLRSMISLINYPGIGIKTMECCFKIVMNYQEELSLFD